MRQNSHRHDVLLALGGINISERLAAFQRVSVKASEWMDDNDEGETPEAPQIINGIAQISINGPMMGCWLPDNPWCCSTTRLTEMVNAFAAMPECKGLLISVNSGGGEITGVPELSAAVKAFASKKPCAAYVTCACSAAYWAICGASKIYAGELSEIGSLGVYAVLTDWSKANENEGITQHLVSSGDLKGAGANGVVTDAEIEQVRGLIGMAAEKFKSDVSASRGDVSSIFTGAVWFAGMPDARQLCDIGMKSECVRYVVDAVEAASIRARLAGAASGR